jgi:FAD/FMN-containing dehydrogenase
MIIINIGSPAPGQTVASGKLVVSGIAVETGSNPAEPRSIVNVSVNSVDAVLGSPPLPERGAVGFSAAVEAGSGEFQITVTATDDIGLKASKSVMINVTGGVVLPIWPGTPWTNYVQTQAITPEFFCGPRSIYDLVAIVRLAEARAKKVHAQGSTYSFSDCAMTTDYMVDTRALRKPVQTVQQALVGATPPTVYHVEAGITIRELYQNLDALGLALETMGGSSGQSIAGAISTGTHGGDYQMSPLADKVLAIHLVAAGGTQYWIEPSTDRITDATLLQQRVVPNIALNNIIYDDATFNACLVSLGCMGIIYAVVLRVRSKYDLVEATVVSTWNDFVSAAKTLLSDSSKRFLQVAIAPYRDSSSTNYCQITTRTEAPPTVPGTRPTKTTLGVVGAAIALLETANAGDLAVWTANGLLDIPQQPITDNQKVANIVQLVMSKTPHAWSFLAENYSKIMPLEWPIGGFRGLSFSVMDTTYGSTPGPSLPSFSIELFFPVDAVGGQLGFVDFVNAALDAINAATSTFLVGYVSLRFTGATRAFLGMQQWNQTCAVEISVVQGVQNEEQLLAEILNMVYRYGGLPHWGQLIDLGTQGNGSLYPGYSQWRQVYGRFSNNFTTRTFENAMSVRWHLTTPDSGSPLPKQAWSGWADLGGRITDLATTVNRDGRIEVFAIGTGKELFHIWQTSPGGPAWSDWADLGGGITKLASAVNADGRLEVFGIGIDTSLYHIWQTSPGGAWSPWTGLGGGITDLATTVNRDGRVELFAIGIGKELFHIWQTSPGGPAWSGWADLGGGITKLASAVNADGRLEVFGIGTDKSLNYIWQTSPGGAWIPWTDLGGGITELATAVNRDGRIEAFAIGIGKELFHIWQTTQ